MEKARKKRVISILMTLTIIFTLIGGTLSAFRWKTSESQRTNVVFTIESDYKCAADGGGNIEGDSLMPASCTNPKYAIQRTVTVTPTIKKDGLNLYMDLWLDINTLGSGLSQSEYFKYALTTVENDCTTGIVSKGRFTGLSAENNDKVMLLSEQKYTTSEPQTYYLYIWIDPLEENNYIVEQSFNFSLGGSCTDTRKPDLQYNATNLSNNNSNTLGQGFYTLSNYSCNNNTTLNYDTYSRNLTATGIDKCDLQFTQTANPKLYDIVEIGDYIAYTGVGDGTNNCTAPYCSGFNAKQGTNETGEFDTYGYCYTANYKFYTYGWRVIHKDSTDNTVYIVSAGAPECVTGTSSNSTATIASLKTASLKYCNNKYLSGGNCNASTAHPFNGDDFYKFTSQYYGSSNARYLYKYNDGGTYGSPYCYNVFANKYCGYNNDLIDNGGYYWFGSAYTSAYTLYWKPNGSSVFESSNYSTATYGLRPVLKLDSTIQAIGGIGVMTNPYQISERVVSGYEAQ